MNHSSLKSKIWLGLAAGLVVAADFRRLSLKYLSDWINPDILLLLSYVLLLAGLTLPCFWHAKEKRGSGSMSFPLRAWTERLLLFALAIDLTMFGWHKIWGLQMIVPLGLLDSPFSELSGENLVWAFFRYSYPFTTLIAIMQMTAAICLLFPKTRLFGLLLAVPLLVFVSLLDFFYRMPVGVLAHGIILLLGVSYFVSRDIQRISAFVFQPFPGVSSLNISPVVKNACRCLIVILPLFFYVKLDHPDKHPALTGKYAVSGLEVNKEHVRISSPKDSVLSTVYFDLEDEIVFRFNDYRYQYIGRYTFDEKTGSFKIRWRFPEQATADFAGRLIRSEGALALEGEMDGQRYRMQLMKK